ncbi:dinuclear metal center YbgI/SA1388 family protein [Croceifilum oryzae]|uniref:GTP cyclohydrolase 1 type 2 homolog n=1 Tax=Croceifilum oryzae TaxID=1553429 RepID=A0AAJ1TD14_9BACL|nr:Nif3-like dinuclear metal center hexameric protein [Croceifilum oryzae]MDQ0416279.1 dinuclear metal center YbgI/SA1388 family protein [Croceifilum oryzae]
MGAGDELAIRGAELISWMETFASPTLAVENDRIGLQVGSINAEVEGVLVTLDVTEEVVDEAIKQGANWIVGHHAIIYQPVKQIRTDSPAGRLLQKCLKHDIQVYIAHTNLDAAEEGVNTVLAEKLGLQGCRTFVHHKQDRLKKLVVFVPESHVGEVEHALGEAGAGCVGNYSHCSFQTTGTGTFLPQSGAKPYIGEQGVLERVAEVRLETIFPESKQRTILSEMHQAHPYEEVAYDLYTLDSPGNPIGMGKIGSLPEQMTLQAFIDLVKSAYHVPHLRFVGDPNRKIKKVALLGGAGSRYMRDAVSQGADVYLTGDIDFHTAQDALTEGITLVDPGHHIEYVTMQRVVDCLYGAFGSQIAIQLSQIDTNPFSFR